MLRRQRKSQQPAGSQMKGYPKNYQHIKVSERSITVHCCIHKNTCIHKFTRRQAPRQNGQSKIPTECVIPYGNRNTCPHMIFPFFNSFLFCKDITAHIYWYTNNFSSIFSWVMVFPFVAEFFRLLFALSGLRLLARPFQVFHLFYFLTSLTLAHSE